MLLKNLYLKSVLLFLFISFAFISNSCSSDEDNSNPLSSRESGFVGTWVLTKVSVTDLGGTTVLTPEQANMSITIQVNSDKTFSMSNTIEGKNENRSGTWNLNGDIIVLTSEGEPEYLPYTVQGNKFSITIYVEEGDILNSRILEFTKQ